MVVKHAASNAFKQVPKRKCYFCLMKLKGWSCETRDEIVYSDVKLATKLNNVSDRESSTQKHVPVTRFCGKWKCFTFITSRWNNWFIKRPKLDKLKLDFKIQTTPMEATFRMHKCQCSDKVMLIEENCLTYFGDMRVLMNNFD